MIETYAQIYVQQLDFDIDEACDEVIEWVNSYINVPRDWSEPTEEERRDSIFAYIKRQIEESTYGRIKASLEKEKACSTTTDAHTATK